MHISIWQQWASNHSVSFTLVGEFQTSDHAQQVADRILQFFQEIDDWFEQPENIVAKTKRDETGYQEALVSGPEQRISAEYNIPWYSYSLDWIYNRGDVSVIDRFVLLAPGETLQDSRPLVELLDRWGHAQQTVTQGCIGQSEHAGIYADVCLDLTCLAPDETSAEKLVAAFLRYFETIGDDRRAAMPWQEYVPKGYLSSAELTGSVQRQGRNIQLQNIVFPGRMKYAFPALLDYLKVHDCTIGQCNFLEKHRKDSD